MLSRLALDVASGCLAAAARAQLDRIHALALPVVVKAWAAAMGQPSPMAGFAVVVLAELGGGLLRLPALRTVIAALARNMVFALAALTVLLAAAAIEAKRPAFVLQTLRDIKQLHARAGYHSAGGRPQCNAQHPPRRTS